jgi:hypothetical protein
MVTLQVYYYFIKIVFFFSIVRALIKFEPIQKHWLFLGLLYTAAVAFLSYIFLVSWQPGVVWQRYVPELVVARLLGLSPLYGYKIWLGETFLLSTLYFKLIGDFEEGVVFWTLLLLGILVALF